MSAAPQVTANIASADVEAMIAKLREQCTPFHAEIAVTLHAQVERIDYLIRLNKSMLEVGTEQIAAVSKDAERYRWLRDSHLSPWATSKHDKTGAAIDATIDAEIVKEAAAVKSQRKQRSRGES